MTLRIYESFLLLLELHLEGVLHEADPADVGQEGPGRLGLVEADVEGKGLFVGVAGDEGAGVGLEGFVEGLELGFVDLVEGSSACALVDSPALDVVGFVEAGVGGVVFLLSFGDGGDFLFFEAALIVVSADILFEVVLCPFEFSQVIVDF